MVSPPTAVRDVSPLRICPGLSDVDVARLREQWGPNLLPAAEQRPLWLHLLDQLVHFFGLLL